MFGTDRAPRPAFLTLLPLAAAFALRGAKSPVPAFAVAAATAAVLVLLRLARKSAPPPAWPILAFAGAAAWGAAALRMGAPLALALPVWIKSWIYLATMILVSDGDTDSVALFRSLGWILLPMAALESVLAAAGALLHRPLSWLSGNPMYAGLLLAAAFAYALVRAQEEQKPARWIAGAMLFLGGQVLLQSRSPLAGSIVAAVVLLARRRQRWIAPLMVALAVAAVALQPAFWASLLRINTPMDWTGRFIIWRTALSAVADRPWFGFGFGHFEAAYLLHQKPNLEFLRFARSTMFAHNDYLQIAVEAGLPALALFLAGIAGLWRAAAREAAPSPLRRWGAASAAAFGVAALFNFTLYNMCTGLVAAAAAGAMLHGAPSAPGASSRWRIGESVLAVVAVAAAFLLGLSEAALMRHRYSLATTIAPFRSDAWLAWAESDLAADPPPGDGGCDACEKVLRAVHWDGSDAFAWARLGVDATACPKYPRMASADAFSRALQLAPRHAPFAVQFGAALLQAGDVRGARAAFDEARRLEPNTPLPWVGLAVIAAKTGHEAEARRFLEMAAHLKKNVASALERGLTTPDIIQSDYGRYLIEVDIDAVKRRLFGPSPARHP